MNIIYHESFEFITALFALAQEKLIRSLIQSKPITRTDQTFDTMLKKMKKLTPSDLQKEVKYFFDLNGIGYLIYNIIFCREQNIESLFLNDFITAIEQLTSDEALAFLICSNYNIDFSELSVSESNEKLAELLKKSTLPAKGRQQRLKEFLENPERLNQLKKTVKLFYYEVYLKIKDETNELCRQGVTLYHRIYSEDPKAFYKHYLGGINELSDEDYVHISFFSQLGIHHYQSKWQKKHCVILGIRNYDLPANKNIFHQLSYFHKVLSDPKRLELIMLISQKPYFGQELAARLDLAPSTTSYHLNMLMDLNLIITTRINKKIFFSFNKEEYNRLNLAMSGLFETAPKN